MALKIQVLAWDRHNNVIGLNPTSLDNWLSNTDIMEWLKTYTDSCILVKCFSQVFVWLEFWMNFKPWSTKSASLDVKYTVRFCLLCSVELEILSMLNSGRSRVKELFFWGGLLFSPDNILILQGTIETFCQK
jgi:hypothetical protein